MKKITKNKNKQDDEKHYAVQKSTFSVKELPKKICDIF